MNELSLFTGAGGGLLASILLGWRTVGAVEWNDYCCKVLHQRQKDGVLDDFPIFNIDIREFNKRIAPAYKGLVDVVSAGFPCQPFSTAGKQLGEDDPRNQWPATIECIRVVRPRFAFLENVPGLINSGYFGTILGDLAKSGYDARWRVLSSAELGAPHLRKRLWIVAYANRQRLNRGSGAKRKRRRSEDSDRRQMGHAKSERRREKGQSVGRSPERVAGAGAEVANPDSSRFSRSFNNQSGGDQKQNGSAYREVGKAVKGKPVSNSENANPFSERRQKLNPSRVAGDAGQPAGFSAEKWGKTWWAAEPDLGRLAHGVANRVDRIKALGNGQVPAVAAAAWRLLTDELVDTNI